MSDEHVTQRERLIGRVIDGEASADDWTRLGAVAAADPAVWADLAVAQRDRDVLSAAVNEAIRVADDLDVEPGRIDGVQRGLTTLRAWGGWAAAAALVLVWLTGIPVRGGGPGAQSGLERAGFTPSLTDLAPDTLLRAYFDNGREQGSVLGEREPIVLEATPAAEGDRLDVVVVRQFIERRTVDRVGRFAVDELGNTQARTVPASDVLRVRLAY